ncbi:MAG: hypothetical protein IPO41_12895 [Acidobacteria bacterium]|nr:hypothetical protein [Acidobacteriota bacterium]
MEIRAWIDDAEGKPQSIEDIKASFVQNEDAYKALYRPFVTDGKIEETLEAPAWMERVADFVAQARAAHEATCTKRLTQLMERLAFEGADLGLLPSKNAFGKEAIKALARVEESGSRKKCGDDRPSGKQPSPPSPPSASCPRRNALDELDREGRQGDQRRQRKGA